eukprot:5954814-Pyramimonas_sp.AAC.1
MGNEPRKRCADMGGGCACAPSHGCLRRNSRWGHDSCEGVPTSAAVAHVGSTVGAFCGPPNETTKLTMGVPICVAVFRYIFSREPSVGARGPSHCDY